MEGLSAAELLPSSEPAVPITPAQDAPSSPPGSATQIDEVDSTGGLLSLTPNAAGAATAAVGGALPVQTTPRPTTTPKSLAVITHSDLPIVVNAKKVSEK